MRHPMLTRIPLAFLVVLLVLLVVGPVRAGKVLGTRTEGCRSTGARRDITVPYLTTGHSAFIAGTYVGPRIYYSPMADEPYLPDVRPVYNLPFWGGILA